jgi:hypothetical protein
MDQWVTPSIFSNPMTAPFQRSNFTHDTTLEPVPIPVRGVTGPAFFGRWMHLPGGGTASSGRRGSTVHQVSQARALPKKYGFRYLITHYTQISM